MFRIFFWLLVWCLSLGFLDIHIVYKDGLEIKLNGPAERKRLKKEEREKDA